MPNWCNNTMSISHPNAAKIKKAAKAWNSGKFLQTMIPCPSELIETEASNAGDDENKAKVAANLEKYGYAHWYDYRVAEWGTKWDVGRDPSYGDDAIVTNKSFSVGFDSAWSPPCAAYAKLKALGYTITAYYYEPGMDFCGRWIDGQDDCYDISKDGVPHDISDEMGIEECDE